MVAQKLKNNNLEIQCGNWVIVAVAGRET